MISVLTPAFLACVFHNARHAEAQADPRSGMDPLERVEADPVVRERLLRDWKAFHALPRTRQEQLRKLDAEIHTLNPSAAARLNKSMVRYVEWLDGLSETRRQYILSAPDGREQLTRIRHIREEEWIESLPQATKDKIRSLTGAARAGYIKEVRSEDQRRRSDWQTAIRHWDELQKGSPPTRRSELSAEVQSFIDKTLLPRATSADAIRLAGAEGQWPKFVETLVELSDKYAPYPGPAKPRDMNDLPNEMQKRIRGLRPALRETIQAAEGSWPDFPLAIANVFRRTRGFTPGMPRLGPCRPEDFDPPIRDFIHDQLEPRLRAEEHRQLINTQGSWPEYPRMLVQLAGRYNLVVPGTLPLPKVYVDKYRAKPIS